ncbi:lymphocyte antigen 6I-like isoform X1 [Apodemus sylvaticus]|uniref:lymphocyte antigen 6I-like isoform X1 n=1 Tax=Apodemus sylvaticus TaxID=10129 RepID=UPI0022446E90|nr:lymphocyte antigen 6I-like isoform X1 [Apodemus sylvaticus]
MDSSHTTKSCLLILLVALLCAERAQGLECYQCMGVPIGTSCPSVTCSYTDGFCIYQEAEVTEGEDFLLQGRPLQCRSSHCRQHLDHGRGASVQPELSPPADLAVMALPTTPTLVLLSSCVTSASWSPLLMSYELQKL